MRIRGAARHATEAAPRAWGTALITLEIAIANLLGDGLRDSLDPRNRGTK